MEFRRTQREAVIAALVCLGFWACSGTSTDKPDGSAGGTAGGGGGGTTSSGGVAASVAGGTGGTATGGDGTSGSGGTPSSGGTSSTNGGTAGTAGTSGSAGEGGATTNGGTSGSGDAGGEGGSAGEGGAASPTGGPCDIYASDSTPCVAAYSMVRALSVAYEGNLYQVRRADGSTKDIGVLMPGGVANAADQDAFCGTDACTVSILYDQSSNGNHLTRAPPNCYQSSRGPSNESDAKRRPLTIGGHRVYALETIIGDGYRDNQTTGMPVGDQSQGIYEVVDGKRVGTACCWDFGNASRDNCLGPLGEANALFFGTGYWGTGAGSGPWFMADFESGVWSGGSGPSTAVNYENPSITVDFAMGVLKTSATNYAIRVGNAQSGNLTTAYDGALPFASFTMEGGIVLGLSSDGTDSSYGTFFEGAITAGRPTNAVDDAVLRNVQAARYGQ